MRSVKVSTAKISDKTKKDLGGRSTRQIDPLYIIFEQHLFNFSDSDSDRKTFITGIVLDYLKYLRKHNVIVPMSLEQPIMEELGCQVNTMLVKKIYGCLSISDYVGTIQPTVRKKAKVRYRKMTLKKEGERKAG